MTLHYVNGDLLSSNCDALVNPVNCFGVMGAGLALQFKQAFPAMYEAYRLACRQRQVKIGQCHVWRLPGLRSRYILNFPTKLHWKDSSRLDWIAQGLEDLVITAVALNLRSIALPKLGCGLGQLHWDDVHLLVQQRLASLPDVDIHLYAHSS